MIGADFVTVQPEGAQLDLVIMTTVPTMATQSGYCIGYLQTYAVTNASLVKVDN